MIKRLYYFVILIVFVITQNSVIADDSKLLAVGEIAPLFSLPALTGKREMLSVWAGDKLSKPYVNDKKHTVIISFWATYCVPCKKEIPQLHEFYEKYKDKNIKIFLISIDSKGASVVVPHIESAGYTLPVLLDPYKRTADRYGVKSVPSLFVISKSGKIIYSAKGFKDDENLGEVLENVIFNTEKETLPINTDKKMDNTSKKDTISSKKKWQAVAAVECGASADSIATSLGVSTSQIKKWYNDIKSSAIKLWGK